MARNSINMARTASGRRRSVIDHKYSLNNATGDNGNYMNVGTNIYPYERTDTFSIEFLVNAFASSGTQGIFYAIKSTSPFTGIIARFLSGSFVWHLVNTFSSNEAKATYTLPPLNTWTHVVCTYSGNSNTSGMKVYYNSVLQTASATVNTLSATIVDATAVTRWGAFPDGTGTTPFKGKFIPKRVFNYELSQAQVNDLWYDNKVTGTAAIDEYAVSEGSGTNVASTGSGAHNGTLVGGAGITWSTDTPMHARSVITQTRLAVS